MLSKMINKILISLLHTNRLNNSGRYTLDGTQKAHDTLANAIHICECAERYSQEMNKLRKSRNRSVEPAHLYKSRIPVLRCMPLACSPGIAVLSQIICQAIGITFVLRITDISGRLSPLLSTVQQVSDVMWAGLDLVGDTDSQGGDTLWEQAAGATQSSRL